MNLNESIAEDAALERFGPLGYDVWYGPLRDDFPTKLENYKLAME